MSVRARFAMLLSSQEDIGTLLSRLSILFHVNSLIADLRFPLFVAIPHEKKEKENHGRGCVQGEESGAHMDG